MRRWRFVAACGVLIQGCARNTPPQPGPVVAESFTFSAKTGPDTLIEGAFDGTAVVRDGWISVVVKPTLSFPPGPHERWRSVTIRSFVATDYGRGTWKAPAASTPVNVWRFLDFGRGPPAAGRTTIVISDSLRFQVPIPAGASLSAARLGFEVEWVTLYANYGQTEQNYAFSGPLGATRPPFP